MGFPMGRRAGLSKLAPLNPASVHTLKTKRFSWLFMKDFIFSSCAWQELNSTSAWLSVETLV